MFIFSSIFRCVILLCQDFSFIYLPLVFIIISSNEYTGSRSPPTLSNDTGVSDSELGYNPITVTSSSPAASNLASRYLSLYSHYFLLTKTLLSIEYSIYIMVNIRSEDPSTEFCEKIAKKLSNRTPHFWSRGDSYVVWVMYNEEDGYYIEDRGVLFETNTTNHYNNSDDAVVKIRNRPESNISPEKVRKLINGYYL